MFIIADIPQDCEEAHEWGYKSGEYLIYPKSYVGAPFYVFCDMDINPGHGNHSRVGVYRVQGLNWCTL